MSDLYTCYCLQSCQFVRWRDVRVAEETSRWSRLESIHLFIQYHPHTVIAILKELNLN